MRVGVYVDGFNLYYGGRRQFGRGAPGWRWLNLRKLAMTFAQWQGSVIEHVVYCTARIHEADNPTSATDQDVYIRALLAERAIDTLELGRYVERGKWVPLCSESRGVPRVLEVPESGALPHGFPLHRSPVDAMAVLAKVRVREEKGSDVNVATHLMVDVLTNAVDAAIVISNDSDLALPIAKAREIVPVGLINPSTNQLAGALRAPASVGVGRHWWRNLDPRDFLSNQMPAEVGRLTRPAGW